MHTTYKIDYKLNGELKTLDVTFGSQQLANYSLGYLALKQIRMTHGSANDIEILKVEV